MKYFNTKRITKKELRLSICNLAKQQGVKKVIFNNKGKIVCGTYNAVSKIIYIDLKQNKKQMIATFLHEMGHHVCVSNNKWKRYHFAQLDVIFDIENKIDKIGSQLWYKYVNLKQWGKYKYFYPKSNKKTYMKKQNNLK